MIDLLARLLAPLRIVLEAVAERVSGPTRKLRLKRGELGTLMEVAQQEGVFTRFEARMLLRVLRLGDTPVERLLRPRVEVVGVSADSGIEAAVRIFESSGLSRLPVYEESLDQVVGVLYLKDLIDVGDGREGPAIHSLMREPFFVPESKPADELFSEFQRRHVHFAVVVDEHGGMEGIVTMEDLIEELIGEIHDESDIESERLEMLSPEVWRADALVELAELGEALDARIGADRDAVTLAGLLEEELGKVPQAGDRVRRDGFEFQVLTARPNRPLLIRVARAGRGDA
jgi:CBS domain containing-hemolysin-like protein